MGIVRWLLASAAAVLVLAPVQAQNVFVADYYHGNVLRVDSSQSNGTLVPPPGGVATTPTGLWPSALAYGPDGNLYSANQVIGGGPGPGTLSKINPTTGAVISTI